MAILEDKKIKIIFEDDWLLILDKPAGIVVTKENRNDTQVTVEDWLGATLQLKKLSRSGIVHRLDKGTSGILVVAKTVESLEDLKAKFKQRKMEKHYWAMVGGDLPGVGNIKMPIIRSNYSFNRFKVGEDGKMAETEFKVVEKYKLGNKVYTLVDVNLKTGRTHQIRVHFSYLGWPLVGDKTYGGEMVLGLDRPYLHAYQMTIKHPMTNKIMTFESDVSQDLKNVLAKLCKK